MMKTIEISYNGLIDEAARFVEKIQLLDKPLWEKVTAVFAYGKYKEGWHGEYWGKLMRGGCIVYKYTKSKELYSALTKTVRDLLDCQDDEGRISTYNKEYELYDWDVWCRKYVMYGLMYYYDICKDEVFKKEILTALISHADYIVERLGREDAGKREIVTTSTFWLGVNSASILRPYVLLYKLTGNKKYLEFAEYIISTGGIQGGNLIDLAIEDKLAPYQYPEVKAYETISFFEGVFEYATMIKNVRLISACLKFSQKILETDITLIGAVGCYDELFDNCTKKQVSCSPDDRMQETCVTVTLMEYMCRMLEYTGDSKYADAIEISFYNAFLGAINRNYGKNEGLHFDSYSPILNGKRGISVGGKQTLLDGSYYGCCAAIGAAGFGAVTSMSAQVEEDTLKVSFYENGKIKFGSNEVCVKTDYPFDGKIELSVDSASDEFGLALRIPAWCENYTLTVNGERVTGILDKGYLVLDKKISANDRIIFDLDMPFRAYDSVDYDEAVDTFFAVAKGPIVFAATDFSGHIFTKDFSSYSFDGRESTLIVTTASGEEVTLRNYAACGIDWNQKMTVWLEK